MEATTQTPPLSREMTISKFNGIVSNEAKEPSVYINAVIDDICGNNKMDRHLRMDICEKTGLFKDTGKGNKHYYTPTEYTAAMCTKSEKGYKMITSMINEFTDTFGARIKTEYTRRVVLDSLRGGMNKEWKILNETILIAAKQIANAIVLDANQLSEERESEILALARIEAIEKVERGE